MFRDINDCFICEGEEAAQLFPDRDHRNKKLLVFQAEFVLCEFPDSWEDDQIWYALYLANRTVAIVQDAANDDQANKKEAADHAYKLDLPEQWSVEQVRQAEYFVNRAVTLSQAASNDQEDQKLLCSE